LRRRHAIERDGRIAASAELLFAASREFVFPARMGAGLPGNQLESGVVLEAVLWSVLRVAMKHPCYQLHSALNGGTGEKHVHCVDSGLPLRSRRADLIIFTGDTQMPIVTEFFRKFAECLAYSSHT
jgi:hypothetical protein